MAKILVVDDAPFDRQRICGLLRKLDSAEVDSVSDAEAALKHIAGAQFDVIITDLNMPGKSGLDLVTQIKKSYPRLPVVLMTSRGSEDLAVSALNHGASSYFSKHSTAERMLETVQRVLTIALEKAVHSRFLNSVRESTTVIELENDPELVGAAVRYLLGLVESLEMCQENERVRVGVALQEALTNACFHGNLEVSSSLREIDHNLYFDLAKERATQSPYKERRIHVSARVSGLEATFVVRDEGPGFDPSTLPDPTDPENLERPCGRGLLLMRTFMDDIRYNSTGNEVTLVKRCQQCELPGGKNQ